MKWNYKKYIRNKLADGLAAVAIAYDFATFVYSQKEILKAQWRAQHITDDKMIERLRVMRNLKPMNAVEIGFTLVGDVDSNKLSVVAKQFENDKKKATKAA